MKTYPKLKRQDNTRNPILIGNKVVIQEKLDGSNVSFGLIDGELKVYSRNNENK